MPRSMNLVFCGIFGISNRVCAMYECHIELFCIDTTFNENMHDLTLSI